MERQLFADILETGPKRASKRNLVLAISLAVHVVGLLAGVIVPLLQAQPLPEPADAIKAFFVEPSGPPPPPPPPPPPAKAPPPKAPQAPAAEVKFEIPKEIPTEIKPSSGDGGGGVEGGVEGGFSGAIVGGLPAAPPPQIQPIRVGGNIKEPTKTKNVAPIYPDIAKQARVSGVVILECTISPQGRVTDIKTLRSLPLLDQAALDAVKQWQYTPTLLNGVPVPVVMTVTVNFNLK